MTSASATRWSFRSRTVNAVYENQDALVECFSELEKSLSNKTVQEKQKENKAVPLHATKALGGRGSIALTHS
jgi:hypothetical protein